MLQIFILNNKHEYSNLLFFIFLYLDVIYFEQLELMANKLHSEQMKIRT